MKSTAKKLLAAAAVIAAAVVAGVITSRLFGTICMFKALTGYPCPGCGMTRAWWAVLHGNFTDALYWHPLFPLVPVLIAALTVYAFVKKPLLRKIAEITLIVICVVFIVVWVVRLANGWR
jgi:Protein of unknown function (DUF2752).